ncbi:Cob(I)yrinic acid a,c-diamide adenosyltransferase [Pseudobythopirellula maris]|uniref:Corrinoid adenosyltransferase n=1 Tax=Pseudobythopirellula maris TaxID=2527991 RepID=A0A5C5ZJA5_9BACT|nr:cob(I)yrinic acid a,c-diamide adenosyltransferase [Pseudobythopirellula maris]TWT87454.1 Cob(I)yrinic acid a,c-diamide adenosyltransferase [Pseudobythopirellula maris]
MKIYTRTGDRGETSLYGPGRVSKSSLRIAAYGTVDELNAAVGVARAELARSPLASVGDGSGPWADGDALLAQIQNRLFDLGSELATLDPEARGTAALGEEHIVSLETTIDSHEATLPPLKQFVLPGGTAVSAQLHLARCVCRRAERGVVTLLEQESLRDEPLRYLNRLSDLLFVLARSANHAQGVGDTPWEKG